MTYSDADRERWAEDPREEQHICTPAEFDAPWPDPTEDDYDPTPDDYYDCPVEEV